ncbi:MAG: DUF2341 domain-containing protein, partial [bacterium]
MQKIKLLYILVHVMIIFFTASFFYCTCAAGNCLPSLHMLNEEMGVQSPFFFLSCKKITIHHEKVDGSSDHIDFPVFIIIEEDEDLVFSGYGGGVANRYGHDIIFMNAQCTSRLDHEIEKYDHSKGTLIAWVRIPILKVKEDTIIYMFYGNCEITSSQENAHEVWDPDYKGVWHLHDTLLDSTENNNTGTNYGSYDTEGKTGKAQYFISTQNDYIGIGNSSSLNFEEEITISAWIRPDAIDIDSTQNIVAHGSSATSSEVMLRIASRERCTTYKNYYEIGSWDGNLHIADYEVPSGDIGQGAWVYLVGVYEDFHWKLYRNGIIVSSNNGAANDRIEVAQERKDGKIERSEITLDNDNIIIISGKDQNNTLGEEISLYVNGLFNTMIRTNCTKLIGPNLTFGSFTVEEGSSKYGGPLCPIPCSDDDDNNDTCGECEGNVTRLTLRYNCNCCNCYDKEYWIEVKDKKDNDSFFAGNVKPKGEFTFYGKDDKGTLGTEIKIYVNGKINTTIHTSCSQPIGPGMTFG